jgi:nucleotide-binding universal stress UspA family protein
MARTYGASLHVLNVVDDVIARALSMPEPVVDVGRLQADLNEESARQVAGLVTDEDRAVLKARTALVTSGTPAAAILDYAREQQIDLIVIGTHGRSGLAHFFMGSVAQHVVRHAPCPVLTVRCPEREFVRPDALECVTTAPHAEPNHPAFAATRP